jgi:hypothetical protein
MVRMPTNCILFFLSGLFYEGAKKSLGSLAFVPLGVYFRICTLRGLGYCGCINTTGTFQSRVLVHIFMKVWP